MHGFLGLVGLIQHASSLPETTLSVPPVGRNAVAIAPACRGSISKAMRCQRAVQLCVTSGVICVEDAERDSDTDVYGFHERDSVGPSIFGAKHLV
eukprot:m.409863 g.409863  ORF g.409863 m.409863 type:complete len:95 (+) comp16804_c0_seq3:177-461(+)